MANLISCRPQSYGKYQSQAYAALQETGIHFVEIGAPPIDQVDRVRGELARYDLKVGSVTLGAAHGDANWLEAVQAAAEAAAMLGTRVIFTSQHAGSVPRDEVYRRLRQAGETCAYKNVTLCLETHPDLAMNAQLARQTMEGVNHPNVRINFDPANVYYYNDGVDAVEELRLIAPYVRAVHLKDSSGEFHAWNFPTLGHGRVRWKELFTILNGEGMTGPFTFEMEGIEGENLTFEQTSRRVKDSLDYLRSIGVVG